MDWRKVAAKFVKWAVVTAGAGAAVAVQQGKTEPEELARAAAVALVSGLAGAAINAAKHWGEAPRPAAG